MLTVTDFEHVMTGVVPLYIALLLGYASLRWWNIIVDPRQCDGISRLNSYFAVPVYVFHMLALSNPYTMDMRIIAADALSKILALVMVSVWARFTRSGSFEWAITIFMLATLPNTAVAGLPILVPMFKDLAAEGSISIIISQGLVWYNVCIILYEIRAARLEINCNAETTGGGSVHPVPTRIHPEECSDLSVQHSSVEHFEEDSGHVTPCDLSVLVPRRPSIEITFQGSVAPEASGICDENEDEIEAAEHAASTGMNLENLPTTPTDQDKLPPFMRPEVDQGPANMTLEQQFDAARAEERASAQSHEEKRGGMIMEVSTKVVKRLVKLPIFWASLLGFSYSLVASRIHFHMPLIVQASLEIILNMALGLCMFVLGLFMATERSLIPCGKWRTAVGMLTRFIGGPVIMAIASLAVGLRKDELKFAIIQAAVPQGLIPFVLAREYNVHATVLSTAVSIQMVIFVPIMLAYYFLIGFV